MAKKQSSTVSTNDKAALLASLEKKYGLKRPNLDTKIVVSTGSLQLNEAMGCGGTVLGKIIELFGPESSGKSTITMHQMAEYQKAFPDKKVALFDYENSFDRKYASALGVDVDELLIYQPDSQEDGYDMVLALIEADLTSCIVIDSQTAAPPKAVVQGEMGDATIALQARINSKFCLKVKGLLTIHSCTLFVISQTRSNIGGMGEGNPTTGGNALKFYADVRWKIWKMNDKDKEQNKTTVDVIKNKLAAPFGQAKFNIKWGVGISKEDEILEYACDFNIVQKSGSWYAYGETKLGQGAEKVLIVLEDNPELFEEIREKVILKLNSNKISEIHVVDPETVLP
jgi:recombination protein RecA